MMNETRELAKWACDLKWEDIPAETRKKTKQCLLDYLGCCLIARDEDVTQILMRTLEIMDGKPQAAVIGQSARFSLEHAALINGALGHMWEIDDTHRKSMSHPGDSVMAVALTLGEWTGVSGAQILAAIVAGYEVAVRICEAASPSHLEKGWHPSGTTNTIGAAACAGKLLGLNHEQMASAFGIAVTQAAGTFCHIPERAMTKDLNPGKAAASGILAGLLAREGFSGSPTALENKKGFLSTHADPNGSDIGRVTEKLGQSFKINEIAFKPYACCRHCHAAVDAMLSLRNDSSFKNEDIKEISVRVYPMAEFLTNDPDPFNKGFYGTRYSVQFNLALALLEGSKGMDRALFDQSYAQTMLQNPQIKEIMQKVTVVLDKSLDKEWPDKWPAVVRVRLADGREAEKLIDYPLGEPENPMLPERLKEKFKNAAGDYLTEEGVTAVIDCVENLERSDTVSALIGLVAR